MNIIMKSWYVERFMQKKNYVKIKWFNYNIDLINFFSAPIQNQMSIWNNVIKHKIFVETKSHSFKVSTTCGFYYEKKKINARIYTACWFDNHFNSLKLQMAKQNWQKATKSILESLVSKFSNSHQWNNNSSCKFT